MLVNMKKSPVLLWTVCLLFSTESHGAALPEGSSSHSTAKPRSDTETTNPTSPETNHQNPHPEPTPSPPIATQDTPHKNVESTVHTTAAVTQKTDRSLLVGDEGVIGRSQSRTPDPRASAVSPATVSSSHTAVVSETETSTGQLSSNQQPVMMSPDPSSKASELGPSNGSSPHLHSPSEPTVTTTQQRSSPTGTLVPSNSPSSTEPGAHRTEPSSPAPDSHSTEPSSAAPEPHTTEPSSLAPDSHSTEPSSTAHEPHTPEPSSLAPDSHSTEPSSTAPDPHTTEPSSLARGSHSTEPSSTAPEPHTTEPSSLAPDSHSTEPSSTAPDPHSTEPSSTAPDPHTTEPSSHQTVHSATGPVTASGPSTSTPHISTNGQLSVADHSSTSGPVRTSGASSTTEPQSPTRPPGSPSTSLSSTTGLNSTAELASTTGVISATSAISTTTNSTNSVGVLIPRGPVTKPAPTAAKTSAPKVHPSEAGVLPCSPARRVSQCLIAIAALAGVATIFMVSTVVLCTKLSTRKHRYRVREANPGTEMMCISTLLPDRSNSYGRQRNPRCNGALIPTTEGDSDEDGGDTLTLNSFLPDYDHVI